MMKQLEHKIAIKDLRETNDSPRSYACQYLDDELGWIPYCATNKTPRGRRILELIESGQFEGDIQPLVISHEQQRADVDANRRAAYTLRVRPFIEEAEIKRHMGEQEEFERLMDLAVAEREKIQAQNPWPEQPSS